MKNRTLLFSLLILGQSTLWAEEAPDVREMMTPGEFDATGLDRLNEQEIDALNAWLLRFRRGNVPPSVAADGSAVDETPQTTAAVPGNVNGAETAEPPDQPVEYVAPAHQPTSDDDADFGVAEGGTLYEAEKEEAKKNPGKRKERIRTSIVGEFRGWSGKTQFRLANGQVWRQRKPGNYWHRASNPEVEIYRNLLGLYMMRVLETGKTVPISRVK